MSSKRDDDPILTSNLSGRGCRPEAYPRMTDLGCGKPVVQIWKSAVKNSSLRFIHRPLPSLRHGLHVRDSILPGRLFLELLGSHSQHRLLGQHLLVGERGLGGEYVGEVGGAPAPVL